MFICVTYTNEHDTTTKNKTNEDNYKTRVSI